MDHLNSLPRSDLYVVYSMSNSPYQQWQGDLLDFSARAVDQPGVIVRMCSRETDYPDLVVKPSVSGYTFVTPSFAELGDSWFRTLVRWARRRLGTTPFGRYHFYCLNKPYAMKAFLEAHPDLDDEARLMWLDPDMVFNRPWNPTAEMVRRGQVCGQHWRAYDRSWCLTNAGNPLGVATAAIDSALMFPFCITVGDMRRINDSFCLFSREIYRRTRDWKSEMYALVTAMASSGLQSHTIEALGTCNDWAETLSNDPSAPISHYTQQMKDHRGDTIWDKRTYTPHTLITPWGRPPDPDRAATLTDRRTLEMLHRHIDWQEDASRERTPAPASP